MKRYSLILLSTLIILWGCGSKTTFPLTFDNFTIKIYDNNKQYKALPLTTAIDGMKPLAELQQIVGTGYTGFINSVVIIKTSIQSWTDMKTLVESNTKKLQIKLLKYTSTDNTSKKVICDDLQYSWYITAFSYQLDNQTLYDGQYFLTDDESLYIISLASADPKDIKSFIKSIGTITCIN